ncbi:MAG: Zn-dependent alcohol dehydrogenase, class III [Rhodobacteraceae bacterium HLUCCA12]|nr:MAG: Zn-dependent alcohol dehydrogenase, class III [Rhodobacteraceae bacterium HLUCCA12]
MKAAVCHAFGAPLTIEEVVLRAPGPGEVQVQIEACAICHSDISYAEGAWGGHLPAVYGHEAAGRVVATGDGVAGFAPGDPVLVTLIRACGRCRNCTLGRPFMCEAGHDRTDGVLSLPDGTVVEQGVSTGAFAEAVVVHESQVVPLPDDIAMDAACLLACGVITGTGAVINTARMPAGATAVVIGAGGVGLNTIQGCALAGASRIIAIDLSDDKLATAREFGATDGLRADTKGLRKAVLGLTGGRGADYVYVTVGAISAYQGAPALAAKGGTVVMVGMPPSGAAMNVEPVIMAATSQTLTGSNMGATVLRRDIPYLVDLYRQGRLKLDELVTRRYRLDQINEAIADTKAGHARRNVIVMGPGA